MNGSMRSRRRWRRTSARLVGAVLFFGLTATLAAGLQVHELRITGANRFPKSDIEATLRHALGAPTIATRAESLRARVRAVPWVAEARVQMSLDGVVTCEVEERVPFAVAVDGSSRMLVDRDGRLLAPAPASPGLLEIAGFAAFPEERAIALAAVTDLETVWGKPLQRIVRTGPRDVELHFTGSQLALVVDPTQPAMLTVAKRVLAAWIAASQAPPLRLDARAPGRVAVLPAPTQEAT